MWSIEQIAHYEYLNRRAAKHVWYSYNVNNYELRTLLQLTGVLFKQGRRAIGMRAFIDNVTNGHNHKRKIFGFIAGLLDKGLIGEVETTREGERSFYVTQTGVSVLELFNRSLVDLDKQIDTQYPKEKKKVVYTYDQISPTTIEDFGSNRYRAFKPRNADK